MKALLLLSVALAVGAVSEVRADDAYERASAIYAGAKLPDAEHFRSGVAWLGKCTHKNLGTTRTSSAIYIHVEADPILGDLFGIMPLFELPDKGNDHQSLKNAAMAKINSPELMSLMGLDGKENAWVESFRGPYNQVKTVYFKEFKQPNGTPSIVLKTWKHNDGDPIYCYYYEEVGSGTTEPVLVPLSPLVGN